MDIYQLDKIHILIIDKIDKFLRITISYDNRFIICFTLK